MLFCISVVAGISVTVLTFLKDRTTNSDAASKLNNMLRILILFVGILSTATLIINRLNPPPEPATAEHLQRVRDEFHNDLSIVLSKFPSNNEVENELDEQFRKAYSKEKAKALKIYNLGKSAMQQHQYNDALAYFLRALQITEIPSFYLSFGLVSGWLEHYEAGTAIPGRFGNPAIA